MKADPVLEQTRRALHGVAELLLAGPQHADCAEITLRVVAGGFGTTHTPDLRVVGTDVLAGDRRAGIDGQTATSLADALGITATGLGHVYSDGSGVTPDDVLHVDPDAAARLAAAYDLGDRALRALSPDQTPILWPEHFDIGISDDILRINYGVSPGDSFLGVPYMYAGPWTPPAQDDFWNQPFGAARELPATLDEVVAFFTEAQTRLSS